MFFLKSESSHPLSYFPAYNIDPTVEEAVESTKVRYKRKIFFYRVTIFFILSVIFVIGLTLGLVYLLPLKNNHAMKTSTPTKLNIYYAASLIDIMERVIGPDLLTKHNILINGTSAGSRALATSIQNGAMPDIFISADRKISLDLMNSTLKYTTNKKSKITEWYYSFSRTRLGFGYSYKSSHLATFQSIQNGTLDWHTAIGGTMKIGRTDPDLDPKGYRTVILIELAETYYNITTASSKQHFEDTFLGNINEPSNIYTEERLHELVNQGDLDVGFFYEAESQWNVNTEFIELPSDIDMSDPLKSDLYSQASYTNTETGKIYYGSPIIYTISILNNAINTDNALLFLQYLLEQEYSGTMLTTEGLYAYTNASFVGNISSLPLDITQQYNHV